MCHNWEESSSKWKNVPAALFAFGSSHDNWVNRPCRRRHLLIVCMSNFSRAWRCHRQKNCALGEASFYSSEMILPSSTFNKSRLKILFWTFDATDRDFVWKHKSKPEQLNLNFQTIFCCCFAPFQNSTKKTPLISVSFEPTTSFMWGLCTHHCATTAVLSIFACG